MTIKLKKVIVHFENIKFYIRQEFDLDKEKDFPYLTGTIQGLIPEKAKLKVNEDFRVDNPLFNKNGQGKIIVPVGRNGLYLLQLRPRYVLDQIILEPDDLIADIYFNEEDECLIYSFYNPTNRDVITITATVTEDIDGIYQKITSYPDDLNWRQHFIRRAMIKTDAGLSDAPKEPTHKYMTAKQVAEYLQLEEKTIRNMTSEGRIPFVKVGGAVRYEKERIDEAIRNGMLRKKVTQQKGKKKKSS